MSEPIHIHFISAHGERRTVSTEPGQSLMETAVRNDVAGIEALCGGALACATCHVYVGSEWVAMLPALSDTENEMLECVDARRPNSRLSCQIRLTSASNGLTVELPESQN